MREKIYIYLSVKEKKKNKVQFEKLMFSNAAKRDVCVVYRNIASILNSLLSLVS